MKFRHTNPDGRKTKDERRMSAILSFVVRRSSFVKEKQSWPH
jgi:hypothetical protein